MICLSRSSRGEAFVVLPARANQKSSLDISGASDGHAAARSGAHANVSPSFRSSSSFDIRNFSILENNDFSTLPEAFFQNLTALTEL